MEVKPGYKQTEVGVIPEEWDVKTLGTVLSKGRLGGNYANQDSEAELPLMKMGNLARGHFDLSKVQFIVPGIRPESVHRLVYGDVLFNTRNTLDLVGKVAIWRDELPVAYYNSNLMRLEFDPEQVCSNEYANYSLNTEGSVSRLRALATGTTSVAAIYTRDLMKLQILVPPLPEQRAIAEALSDVDGLLGGLDRLIAKKRDLKQAAMQQLLTGQTRLPGFHGEWVSVRLGDVADPTRSWSFTGGPFGSNLKSSDYTESGVRIIQLQNIGDGEFKTDYEIYTSVQKADELLSCNIYPGEIILSKMGDPVARACIIPSLHDRYLMCSDGIRLAVDPTRFAAHFVFAQINAPDFRGRAANAGTGSTRKRIGLTELRNLELQCPPTKAEQTAIAAVLSEMDGELAKLEQRREKTRALKQALMQELLTGRTRLV